MPLDKNDKQAVFDWAKNKIPESLDFNIDGALTTEKDFKDTFETICDVEENIDEAKRKVLLSVHLHRIQPKLLHAIQLNMRYERPILFKRLPLSPLNWPACKALNEITDLGGRLENDNRFKKQAWNEAHNKLKGKVEKALDEYDQNRKKLLAETKTFWGEHLTDITLLHTLFVGIHGNDDDSQVAKNFKEAKEKIKKELEEPVSRLEDLIKTSLGNKLGNLEREYTNLKIITNQIMSTVNKLCLSEVVVPFVSDTRKIALDSMSEAITINECYDLLTYCQKRSEVSDNTGVNLRDYANLLGLTTQAGRRRLSSTQLSQEQFTPPKQQEVGGGERFTVCAIAEDDRIISIGEITKNYKEVKNMIDKNSDEEAVKKDLEKINKGLINNSTEWGKLHGFWVGQINQKLIDLTGKELEDHEKLNNHKKEVHAEEIWIFRFAKDLSNKLDENIDKIKRIEILSTYVSCGETTKNCRIRIIGRIVKLLKKKLKEANRNEDEIEVILFTFKDDEAHRYGLGEQLAYKVLENDNEIDLSLLGEWQDDDQNHGSTSASSSSASASSSSLLSGMEVILKKS